jgi:hypothetical protein
MKHTIQFASDVIRDGMGVELIDSDHQVLAELFRSDVTGEFHLTTFENEISAADIRMMFDAATEREGLSFAIPSEEVAVIYVELLSEAVRCFRPVLAHRIGERRYRIDSSFQIPEDEDWAFQPGSEVICEDTGGRCLTPKAVALASTNSEQVSGGNGGQRR